MKRVIQNKEYNFSESDIFIRKLRFWPENPRVYSEIYGSTEYENSDKSLLQEKIFQTLKNRNDVRELRQQIESTGGLTEPLIVRNLDDDYYYVLEGNRRLAACRIIIDRNTDKDSKLYKSVSSLRCEVVGEDINESVIFSLLGTLHIEGKHPWTPFEKAHYLKRRLKDTGDLSIVSRESGERSRKVQTQIDNIKLMEEAGEENEARYSYYDTLNRNRKTKKAMEDSPSNKKKLLEMAKTWDGAATHFRDDLKATFDDRNATKKFLRGNKNLEDAAEEAREKGSTNVILKKIRTFRESMSEEKKEIISSISTNPNLKYEFNKLKRTIEQIDKELEEKESG